MEITADISLYPLNEKYKEQVMSFIKKMEKENPGMQMQVNGMSTQIAGPFDDVMNLIRNEIEGYLNKNEAVFVLKIAKGCNIERED